MFRRHHYAVLLYRDAIAEVYAVKCLNMCDFGRNAKRLFQGSLGEAEAFAQGMGTCGVVVRTAYCLGKGDAIHARWTDGAPDGIAPTTLN
jgi:cytosine/uracil/thiamine/allantoin permease